MAEQSEYPGEDRRGLADIVIVAATAIATTILFFIDATQPRGVVDGIGYPAVVAITARYGRGPLLGTATLCTLLIVLAHFLVPDAGISVIGELGNRLFAVAAIWIVADLMQRRLKSEAAGIERTRILRRNQAALARIVREALVAEHSFLERLQIVNAIAGQTIGAELTSTFRFFERGLLLRCLDAFQASTGKHFVLPDIRTEDTPGYDRLVREDYTLVIDDMSKTRLFNTRQLMLETLNIHASLAVGVLANAELAGQVIFARVGAPYKWTDQDIAFARAVGNLVTTIFAAERNAETLAALDLVGEGIFTETEQGAAVYANSAAIEIALAGQAAADRPLSEIAFPRPAVPLIAGFDQTMVLFAGRELEIQRTRLPDGGIISRVDDVTSRNAARRERDQLQARLQQAAKMEAIGQLAGGVAHDFNNILGAIMGFAGFLQQDLPETSEQHHFADRILSASQRGKELVDQILTFARTRAPGGDTADLGRALRQTAELVKGSFPSSIELDLPTGADGLFVACGPSRLSQLLLNLCINARDAIGEKPGRIALSVARVAGSEPVLLAGRDVSGEITVGEASATTDYARIRVVDSGSGIAPEILSHIFEPFYTTKDRQRGTGLGLAVVHGVIDSCAGFGHVRAATGQGTEFSVYLPLAEPEPSAAEDESAGGSQLPRGTESVLVVDDEPDIVDMMVIGLERLGYRAVGVSDPREALEAFTEDPQAFDIVVTDLVMPSLRGTELIAAIKAIRPDIRTILCTAFSDSAAAGSAHDTVADAAFRKPVGAGAIAGCIRALRDKPVTAS